MLFVHTATMKSMTNGTMKNDSRRRKMNLVTQGFPADRPEPRHHHITGGDTKDNYVGNFRTRNELSHQCVSKSTINTTLAYNYHLLCEDRLR